MLQGNIFVFPFLTIPSYPIVHIYNSCNEVKPQRLGLALKAGFALPMAVTPGQVTVYR